MGPTIFWACVSLKINFQKSKIIPIGEVEDFDILASLFGCKV